MRNGRACRGIHPHESGRQFRGPLYGPRRDSGVQSRGKHRREPGEYCGYAEWCRNIGGGPRLGHVGNCGGDQIAKHRIPLRRRQDRILSGRWSARRGFVPALDDFSLGRPLQSVVPSTTSRHPRKSHEHLLSPVLAKPVDFHRIRPVRFPFSHGEEATETLHHLPVIAVTCSSVDSVQTAYPRRRKFLPTSDCSRIQGRKGSGGNEVGPGFPELFRVHG